MSIEMKQLEMIPQVTAVSLTPGQFDFRLENALIAKGSHFFCSGCLQARPVTEQSTEEKYCRGCFDYRARELQLTVRERPGAVRTSPVKPQGCDKPQDKETEGGRFVTGKTMTEIAVLSGQGLSSRAIAEKLGGISYRTVARAVKKLQGVTNGAQG